MIELSRKLILSGLVGLVGRGSIAQAFVATVIVFFFFAVSLAQRPYKSPRMNWIKLFSEAQLFGILLVCVILQVNAVGFATEVVTVSMYGKFMTAVTVSIVPFSCYSLVRNAIDVRDIGREKLGLRRVGSGDDKAADSESMNSPLRSPQPNELLGPPVPQAGRRPPPPPLSIPSPSSGTFEHSENPLPRRTHQHVSADLAVGMSSPRGWQKHMSEEYAQPYWYNEVTGETTWVDPTEFEADNNDDDDNSFHGGEGWTEHWSDEHGAFFYSNDQTGEVSWSQPDL